MIIDCASRKKQSTNNGENPLNMEIKPLEHGINSEDTSSLCLIQEKKDELREIRESQPWGSLTRASADLSDNNDTTVSFLLDLENINFWSKYIESVNI